MTPGGGIKSEVEGRQQYVAGSPAALLAPVFLSQIYLYLFS